MPAKAVTYSYINCGGCVEIEDANMGHALLISSESASLRTLRRRAAKRLRAMADKLDLEAGSRRGDRATDAPSD